MTSHREICVQRLTVLIYTSRVVAFTQCPPSISDTEGIHPRDRMEVVGSDRALPHLLEYYAAFPLQSPRRRQQVTAHARASAHAHALIHAHAHMAADKLLSAGGQEAR